MTLPVEPLVSLDEAKDRLRIDTSNADDADILAIIQEATDLMFQHLAADTTDYTPATLPPRWRLALLRICQNVYDGTPTPIDQGVLDTLAYDHEPVAA